MKAERRKPQSWFRLRQPGRAMARDARGFYISCIIMLFRPMPSKQQNAYELLYADITHQDMTISGHQEDPYLKSHLSLTIKAIARDGLFQDQELELQISRKVDYDSTIPYAGALFQSKPSLMFGVSTNPERFGHLVTLISTKALKELYLCFEPPRYGKAKIISWHVSTEVEPEA